MIRGVRDSINVRSGSSVSIDLVVVQLVILIAELDELVGASNSAGTEDAVVAGGQDGIKGVSIQQSVGEHDGDPLTGSSAVDVGLVAAQQANDGSIAQDILGPVGAHILTVSGIVADGGQQHLGRFSGLDGVGGIELAFAAVDQAQSGQVVDVAGIPGGSGDISEQIRNSVGGSLVVVALVQDDIDHLGNFGTGDGGVGVEVTLLVTGHDVERIQQLNRLRGVLIDGSGILIGVRSVASENRHGEDHGQSQAQREDLFESAHGLISS